MSSGKRDDGDDTLSQAALSSQPASVYVRRTVSASAATAVTMNEHGTGRVSEWVSERQQAASDMSLFEAVYVVVVLE